MKLQLDQSDLHAAIKDYIKTLGLDLEGKSVSITFVASRSGGAGTQASVDIQKVVSLTPEEVIEIKDKGAVREPETEKVDRAALKENSTEDVVDKEEVLSTNKEAETGEGQEADPPRKKVFG